MVQIYWDQCKSIGTLMQCPKVGVIRVHVFGFGFWNHSIWWDKGWRGCGYLPNTQTDNSAFKQLNAPLHWPSQTDAGTPRARSFAGQIPVVLTFLALNTPQKAAFFFFFFFLRLLQASLVFKAFQMPLPGVRLTEMSTFPVWLTHESILWMTRTPKEGTRSLMQEDRHVSGGLKTFFKK